jgi:putative Ca2+/H+ antiporter (TMEM165/GDT1 family)
VATLLLQGFAVVVGSLVGDRLPTRPIQIVAGLAFLGFALWTFLDRDDDESVPDSDAPGDESVGATASEAVPERRSGLLAAGTSFFVSEFGDKTMLATVTLATQNGAFGTWLGASGGMILADALAVAIGAVAGTRLPRHVVRLVAASMFALFGVAMILAAALDA